MFEITGMARKYVRMVRLWRNNLYTKAMVWRYRKHLRVIIGASSTGQPGWVSTDYPQLDITDERTFAALMDGSAVSNFLAEHVWEHLSLEQGACACRNCHAYLARGGVLRIAVPDGFHRDAGYIEQVRPGGSGAGADDHKVLYNYKTLSALLESAGFKIELLEWFDEYGQFHYQGWDAMNGMVRRSTRFDPRNRINPTAYTSLIIDATKL